jgi:hypothetical protein
MFLRFSPVLQDVNTNSASLIEIDRHQDCNNFHFKEISGGDGRRLAFSFTRPFDTCSDEEDYVIQVSEHRCVIKCVTGHITYQIGLNY